MPEEYLALFDPRGRVDTERVPAAPRASGQAAPRLDVSDRCGSERGEIGADQIVDGGSVGLMTELTAAAWSAEYKEVVAFAILVLVMVLRPQGLLAKRGALAAAG